MSIELVTGHTGDNHVTAEQFGLLNAALFGSGNYLLDSQDKIEPRILTANSIEIGTGDILMQGRHVTFPSPTTLTITSGTEGHKRIDLVVVRYTKDLTNNREKVSLEVIEGTPTTGTPSVPMHSVGNILTGGSTLNEVPLFQVHIDGLAPTSITRSLTSVLSPTVSLQEDMKKQIDVALIPNSGISTAKLANGSVTKEKIGYEAIDGTKIGQGQVTARHISEFCISWNKLAAGAVIESVIAGGAVTNAKIANKTITGSKIANGTITKELLASSALLVEDSGTKDGWWYVKFASGIAICGKTASSATFSINQTWGSMYCSPKFEGYAYPFTFASVPCVIHQCNLENGSGWIISSNDGTTKRSPGGYYVSPRTQPVKSSTDSIIAIGRWK